MVKTAKMPDPASWIMTRRSEITSQMISYPTILILKIFCICPTALQQGQQLNHKLWRNLSWKNCTMIILKIAFSSASTYIIISDKSQFNNNSLWKTCRVLLYWLATIVLIRFLLIQKELVAILNQLERILASSKRSTHAKVIKRKVVFIVLILSVIITFRILIFAWSTINKITDFTSTARIPFLFWLFHQILTILHYYIIPSVLNLFFCTLCLMFSQCLHHLLEETKSQNDSTLTTQLLLELLRKYKKIYLIFKQFNQHYSKVLFAWYFEFSVSILILCPDLINQFNQLNNYQQMDFSNFCGLFHNVVGMICVTVCGGTIQTRFLDVQNDILEFCAADGEMFSRREVFLEKMSIFDGLLNLKLKLKVWGFFSVDKKLLLSVLLNTITIVVIVVQMPAVQNNT